MDQNLAMLVGIVAAPIVLLALLRTNAVAVFFSLCLGYVLMQFLGGDAALFTQLFLPHALASAMYVKLGLLLIPPLFTSIFMMRTIKGTMLLVNVVPSLALGFLLLFMVVPLLPAGTNAAVTNLALWHTAMQTESLIVAASAAVCLALKWVQRPRHSEGEAKKHKG